MKNIMIGIVVALMPGTATVSIESTREHPIYRKKYRVTRKFKAIYDGKVQIGDKVEMVASRRLSATKRFSIVKVIAHENQIEEVK